MAHLAVDALGEFLTMAINPANASDRAQLDALAEQVQAATGETVELSFVDHGYSGEPSGQAPAHGIRLEVLKLAEANRGLALLPRRWVVERTFAFLTRVRRLAADFERLPQTLVGPHLVAFATLMLHRVLTLLIRSP